MHKPESAQENETYKILWDFEISTDPPIPVRRPDCVNKQEKRTYPLVEDRVPSDHGVKKTKLKRLTNT